MNIILVGRRKIIFSDFLPTILLFIIWIKYPSANMHTAWLTLPMFTINWNKVTYSMISFRISNNKLFSNVKICNLVAADICFLPYMPLYNFQIYFCLYTLLIFTVQTIACILRLLFLPWIDLLQTSQILGCWISNWYCQFVDIWLYLNRYKRLLVLLS